MTATLEDVLELLNGEAEVIQGFEGDEAQAEAESIINYRGKPYCIVRNWTLVDIDVTDTYRADLAGDGLEPIVLYASDVLIHSAGKRDRGNWVRSTFQLCFQMGYLFETQNTCYLLLGPGRRKRAHVQTVMAIF